MKICTTVILLTLLCPGGCPVYDFDVKTIEQPIQFNDDLKWQADLNQEMTQSLFGRTDNKDVAQYDRNDMRNNDNTFTGKETEEETNDISNTELAVSDTKLQRECKNGGKKKYSKSRLDFVGTNLFDGIRKKCFTTEEVALLTARRDFDMLLPKDLPQCLLNDEMVSVYMQYFFAINQVIQRMNDDCSKSLTEKAFYDTLGGYLKYYVLPVTKYSYYAGKVSLKTVDNVVALYQQCKNLLNTNGNGWRPPMENVLTELKNVHIKPMKFDCKKGIRPDNNRDNKEGGGFATEQNESEESSYCTHLDLSCINSDTEEDQMIVALPKLEAEDCDGYLGNIWLPFKRKRTFNLRSRKSAFVVVKFFETVTRCYRFQCLCQDTYNAKFKAWIVENIQVHLADEEFYPGLGAILRISENLKREKKAAFDNDYEDEPVNDESSSFDLAIGSPKHARAELSEESDWKHGKRGPCKEKNGENNRGDEGEMPDDETEMAGQFQVKVDCPVMPFPKKKHKKKHNHNKPECPKKSAEKQKQPEKPKPKPCSVSFMDWITQKIIMDYMCWFIFFLLILLLLILLCAMLKKRKRKPKPPPPEPRKPKLHSPPPPPPPEPKKKGGLCGCFRKNKQDDDEMYVKSDSASVQPQPDRRKMTSSSSSALAFKPGKCIPINKKLTRAGRDSDKSDAPIIATTSMDYSSSEPEDKSFKRGNNKSKIVTVDEKKKNRRHSNNSTSKTPRIGLQRNSTGEAEVKSNDKRLSETDRPQTESDRRRSETDQSKKSNPREKRHSTSWETVYET